MKVSMLAFAAMAATSQAFSLSSSSTSRHSAFTSSPLQARQSPVRLHVTSEKQNELTTEEEDLLFGGDSKDIPFPSRHRKKDRNGNWLEDKSLKLSELDHSTTNPLINKLHSMRDQLESCPQLWTEMAQIDPKQVALIDNHLCDNKISWTFSQMEEQVRTSAAIFQRYGVEKGKKVAIFAENSANWLLADHGIQRAGGASAVRGADAPLDELRFIYEHSDSAGIAVLQSPKLLKKLQADAKAKDMKTLGLSNEKHGPLKHVILLNREKATNEDLDELAKEIGVTIEVLGDLVEKTGLISESQLPVLKKDDLSTIVYTSGTTGQPKGVMLTHGNLLHQISHRLSTTQPYEETEPLPGETMVSILPVWHITERVFELWMLTRGCKVVYSSIRTFKNDMAKHKPEWLVLVPRVLEKIAAGVQDKFSSGSAAVKALSSLFTKTGAARAKHNKISKGLVVEDEAPGPLERLASKATLAALSPLNKVGDKLVWSKVKDGFGGNLKTIISGGSALSGSLEKFYEAAGFQIIVGYGLTECSPLLAFRRSDANMVTAGCCGKPCLDTEVRVVDPESKATAQSDRKPLPIGEVGVVIGRGPQVMKGYYKNPEATAKAIDQYGWFDTGDLGRINPATGDLILTGRAKDTIVLSNGENIEPQPIEDAVLGSTDLIEQVMLTGQDGRRLVAIAVLSPSELAKEGYLSESEGKKLQKANEAMNDPKVTLDEVEVDAETLRKASEGLRKKNDLSKALMDRIKASTKDFRKWEQVGDVYITLEPFAMVNGQLTQSYKVKRDSVMERYGDELPK